MSKHRQPSFLDLGGEVLLMLSANHFGICDETIPAYSKNTTLTGYVEGLKFFQYYLCFGTIQQDQLDKGVVKSHLCTNSQP